MKLTATLKGRASMGLGVVLVLHCLDSLPCGLPFKFNTFLNVKDQAVTEPIWI